MTPHTDLVTALRTSAQAMIAQQGIRDRDTMIGQLVVSAVELIPAADGGGISRTLERNIRSSHATTQAIYDLDQAQDQLGEGPCIEAADDPPANGTVVAHDLHAENAERWPRFAPRAAEAGFRSMMSVSLHTDERHRAALNLYSAKPHAFDDDAITLAGLFASQAAALLYGADTAANLGVAVESRDIIGRAKGILMERFKLTDTEAFEMLVTSSQNTNMKLTAVATWLNDETEGGAHSRT